MSLISILQNNKKLILFGICSYLLFIYQLVDVVNRSNNLLQVLLYLFSSSQTSAGSASLGGNDANTSTDFVYGNRKCFFVTMNFLLFNVFIFVNNFLIKFLLFGELRMIEIENLNNRFIKNIINEVISITVMINREYANTQNNHQTDINFYIRNSKINYGLNILIYLVVSISLKVIFWLTLDRLDMIYNRHSNEHLNVNTNSIQFTGNSLKEDRDQLLKNNFTFILRFYQSKYFLILACLSWFSVKMALSYLKNGIETSSLSSISFQLFFSLFSIQLATTWAQSIVHLIDFYKSKSQHDEITIKLRESMRQSSKVDLESPKISLEEIEKEEEEEEEEEEEIDSDDEGIFGASETFERKYRLELLINVISNILHIMCRFVIGFSKNDFSGLASFFSNELLMQIHRAFTDSRKLINIYNKYEQLQELPSPTERECKEQDTCIICMDSLYPTKNQKNLILKNKKSKDKAFISETLKKFKPKILPCGHFLHLYCLKNWFERSKNCPMCRMDIFETSTGKLKKQQVFRNRNRSLSFGNTPASSTGDLSYLQKNDDYGVPVEDEVFEEDNKESFHNEQTNTNNEKIFIDKTESIENDSGMHTENEYDYKDVSNHGNTNNSIVFKTYKHKEPVYCTKSGRLVLSSYDFYVEESKFKLENEIKLDSDGHEGVENKYVDEKSPIKIKLDTSGFIPI
ncbi:hypothetical protein HANVADRAFT_6305 [Hanseniaspora valbyensis NRRL Y-1626]|uniref:RING-type domain-containing protein n=1 Tax=Hanseniaspora valbyensis NRRL Y-1626 TaxID=766949 RepID=A0A1B7TEY5_9ASCO|nr:hypothetical protein HANVADRAFT_6305 [Hanseniaspora valbyensis NRRL Y-1626]